MSGVEQFVRSLLWITFVYVQYSCYSAARRLAACTYWSDSI